MVKKRISSWLIYFYFLSFYQAKTVRRHFFWSYPYWLQVQKIVLVSPGISGKMPPKCQGNSGNSNGPDCWEPVFSDLFCFVFLFFWALPSGAFFVNSGTFRRNFRENAPRRNVREIQGIQMGLTAGNPFFLICFVFFLFFSEPCLLVLFLSTLLFCYQENSFIIWKEINEIGIPFMMQNNYIQNVFLNYCLITLSYIMQIQTQLECWKFSFWVDGKAIF